ncbi:MAG: helicase-exonuclease AddAB subunit AddA [Clostridiales bacterium]|jgi:ATP-dependent helicase/nuclease subunit A|nr:helicase-exonuclease AddAB subunit AddA [Clostridiales bacterium]
MPNEYTKEQKRAIETTGGNLLVSAAAGSGKTAVLTERILRMVTSGEADISQLLVVTFTEAAAAEMRERIEAKMTARLNAEPGNARLARQLSRLPSARISTIHAFCRRLVKEHFQLADIDPAFRVADDTELSLLKAQAMDELFDEEYEKESNDEFIDLVDAFGGKTRDDRLDALVRALHGFLENSPYPEKAAREYVELFKRGAEDLDATPWAKIIREELSEGLNGATKNLETALKLCRPPQDAAPEKYLPALQSDFALVQRLTGALYQPFGEMYRAFTENLEAPFARLYAYRTGDGGPSEALKERVKRLRQKGVKDRINDLYKDCFFTDPETMRADIGRLYSRIKALVELTLRFREKYAAEKRARNLLDFNDLEHFAIQVLIPEGTAAGPAAESLRQNFREVLIDEYQDSNEVQETILSAAAVRRFMVGDIKQSIYRFRRAQPGLFAEKYAAYAKGENAGAPPLAHATGVAIDLSKNFRSRREVLDTVNFFFSQLMTEEVGDVTYDSRAALYPGADYPEPPGGVSFDTVIDLAAGSNDAPVPEPAEGEDLSSIEKEAAIIARRIQGLIGAQKIWDASRKAYRPCRPNDIVILTRSAVAGAVPLAEALRACDIDAIADHKTGFFETQEIKTALAFLRVADNPRQDIELLAVLSSPVYAFTPDELLLVRETDPEADFYECLTLFEKTAAGGRENPAVEKAVDKARRFLSDLTRWRAQAVWLPVSRLIGIIYDDTRYPAYCAAMPGGRVRQANLRLLLERAVEYEETSFKGLFHFVRFIRRLQDAGAGSVSEAQAFAETEDRVRVMTIHKAKGLEFPVVFVSLLGRGFNREDERKSIVLHQTFGLGPEYIDIEAGTRSNTAARLALSKLARRESLSEEVRVLYVALTRAKELLVLTGYVSDFERKRVDWALMASQAETALPVYFRRESGSFLDWLMPCLARHRDGFEIRMDEVADECANPGLYEHPARFALNLHGTGGGNLSADETAAGEGNAPRKEAVALTPPHVGTEPALRGEPAPVVLLDDLYDPPYPFAGVLNLPSKVSISELKRLFAPEVSPDSGPLIAPDAPRFEPPAFIRAEQGVTALSLGTALHTVTEHINLEAHRAVESIETLIRELTEKNLLTREEADALDRNKILRFARSGLADRMRASGEVRRETPFVMALPAGEIYGEKFGGAADETILVHGIIDCYFEEGGEIVLVDYKSDSVTGSPEAWAGNYRVQMGIYQKAVERATGKRVKETLLYSFSLNSTVAIAAG